jgi:hypothetical protein
MPQQKSDRRGGHDRAAQDALKRAVASGKVATSARATSGRPAQRSGQSRITGRLRRADTAESQVRRQRGVGTASPRTRPTAKPSTGSH